GLIARHGVERLAACTTALLDQAERLARHAISAMPDGAYTFTDWIDDDGIDPDPIPITVTITVAGDRMVADFTGSAPQVKGAINSPLPFTKSAVYACVRHLIGGEPPNNEGYFRPIEVIAPAGTVVESPILIERCGYVPDPGGPGTFRGGLALVRQYRFLAREATVQPRTDRRPHLPYGLAGGHPGTPSANLLDPGTPDERVLPAKCTISVQHGDVFRHVLGGAGGWGDPRARDPELVRRDVMEEKITPEYALRHYG